MVLLEIILMTFFSQMSCIWIKWKKHKYDNSALKSFKGNQTNASWSFPPLRFSEGGSAQEISEMCLRRLQPIWPEQAMGGSKA